MAVGWIEAMEQISEVWRVFCVKEEEFELDVPWDWEPVKVLEDGGDVVVGVGEQVSSGVLDVLEFI